MITQASYIVVYVIDLPLSFVIMYHHTQSCCTESKLQQICRIVLETALGRSVKILLKKKEEMLFLHRLSLMDLFMLELFTYPPHHSEL